MRHHEILDSQFNLRGQALRHYQNWLSGFEGHDKRIRRDQFRGSALKGWDASALVSRLKEAYPRVALSNRLPFKFSTP